MTFDSPQVLYGAREILRTLGQNPSIHPMSPAGHATGMGFDASIASQVWAANELATHGDLSTVIEAAPDDRIDAVGYHIGVGAWSDRTVNALKPFVNQPPQLFTAAVNSPEYLTS